MRIDAEHMQQYLLKSAWGDHEAFAALYCATAPSLLALATRILANRDQAEDVVQEAFVRAWYHAKDYDPTKGTALAWLAGTMRHCALDRRRNAQRHRARQQARASWLLSATAAGRALRVSSLAPQPLPPDRAFQLWAKLPGIAAVQPVGLIPASGRTTLLVPEPLASTLSQAEKFGVSVEPPGGSLTGQPTTTPLYHGGAPVKH